MAASDSVDQGDLKKVKGIGVRVEARLKDAGITTLERLARTPVNELAAVLDGLPGKFDADRITREEWLPQAVALAVTPATPAGEPEPAKLVRHNFTVEVRLDIAGRDIVSSKIVHVQTGDEAAWAGWEPDRVVAFIEDRAGTRSAEPTIEPVPETGLAFAYVRDGVGLRRGLHGRRADRGDPQFRRPATRAARRPARPGQDRYLRAAAAAGQEPAGGQHGRRPQPGRAGPDTGPVPPARLPDNGRRVRGGSTAGRRPGRAAANG